MVFDEISLYKNLLKFGEPQSVLLLHIKNRLTINPNGAADLVAFAFSSALRYAQPLVAYSLHTDVQFIGTVAPSDLKSGIMYMGEVMSKKSPEYAKDAVSFVWGIQRANMYPQAVLFASTECRFSDDAVSLLGLINSYEQQRSQIMMLRAKLPTDLLFAPEDVWAGIGYALVSLTGAIEKALLPIDALYDVFKNDFAGFEREYMDYNRQYVIGAARQLHAMRLNFGECLDDRIKATQAELDGSVRIQLFERAANLRDYLGQLYRLRSSVRKG